MPSWKGKTRGGLLGYKIFIFVLKRLGLSAAYFLLRFVCLYFVVFAPSASRSSFRYFRRIMGYGIFGSFLGVYKCYFLFGQTLIDKIAIASGMKNAFQYTFDGMENLKSLKDTGGIIIGAHLGNWDIAGLLLADIDLKTNILVVEAEHEKIKKFLEQVMNDRQVTVIPMKQDFSHLFRLNSALKNKEVVCMHGDRFVLGSRVAQRQFMGKKATFPLGPFNMVSKLKVPFCFAYAVRGRDRTYHLSSTPIHSALKEPDTMLDQYVEHLEIMLKANPYQWFNFYDFWNDTIEGAKLETPNE